MARGEARQQLLDSAIDYVTANGMSDLSLRTLATGIGTSHRMLSHHFGSKEGLWVAIVQEVERRQLAMLHEIVPDPTIPVDEALRAWWQHISDPSLWPNARLFFEVYGQALHRRLPTDELLDGIVESWVAPAATLGESMGVPAADARRFARLGLAVSRGLLLDLLATEDRAEVDAAMELWIEMNHHYLPR